MLRWLGAGLVAVGLFVAYTRYPTRPPDSWDIRSFELDSEQCEQLRQQRLTTELEVVPEDDALPTYGEVARKFNLELELLCRANGLPADCGATVAPDGETLVMPLYRDPAYLSVSAADTDVESLPAGEP
ncbi:MAG: hypothetical protein AAF560_22625 [Acidobacteriota bacterium]